MERPGSCCNIQGCGLGGCKVKGMAAEGHLEGKIEELRKCPMVAEMEGSLDTCTTGSVAGRWEMALNVWYLVEFDVPGHKPEPLV